MTPHFNLAEFTASDVAARQGLNNSMPPFLVPAATETLQVLERIRAALCSLAGHHVPIIITSGYRSPAVNAAVGSRDSSDHQRAAAVDWKAPAFGTPLEICCALAPQMGVLRIGQLIYEFGTWMHTSTRAPAKPANRIITINRAGARVGIVDA